MFALLHRFLEACVIVLQGAYRSACRPCGICSDHGQHTQHHWNGIDSQLSQIYRYVQAVSTPGELIRFGVVLPERSAHALHDGEAAISGASWPGTGTMTQVDAGRPAELRDICPKLGPPKPEAPVLAALFERVVVECPPRLWVVIDHDAGPVPGLFPVDEVLALFAHTGGLRVLSANNIRGHRPSSSARRRRWLRVRGRLLRGGAILRIGRCVRWVHVKADCLLHKSGARNREVRAFELNVTCLLACLADSLGAVATEMALVKASLANGEPGTLLRIVFVGLTGLGERYDESDWRPYR
jgi:hypothetical protein